MFFFRKKNKSRSLDEVSDLKIPQHIAIIMDGNARWAKQKNLPLKIGHKTGSENVRKISENCIGLGVKFLTIYAFSSENWDRPQEEVNYLMKLLEEYLEKETKPLIEQGVKILISGNLQKLAESTKTKIKEIEEITKNNKALTLNVAFSYGARQELVDAVKKISEQKIPAEKINETLISQNLYHPEIPDPDLLVRTAGDLRVSNFLLWQIAYSELYFTETYWPDFDKKNLLAAIQSFNKRERRYGKR